MGFRLAWGWCWSRSDKVSFRICRRNRRQGCKHLQKHWKSACGKMKKVALLSRKMSDEARHADMALSAAVTTSLHRLKG